MGAAEVFAVPGAMAPVRSLTNPSFGELLVGEQMRRRKFDRRLAPRGKRLEAPKPDVARERH
jgi:hypothetical protein